MSNVAKWIGGAILAVAVAAGSAFGATTLLGESAASASAEESGAVAIDPVAVESASNAALVAENSATAAVANADDGAETLDTSTPAEPEQAQAADASELAQPLVIKRILPINGPIRYGEWHWDDEGVPDGPLVMTVDLDARVLSIFRDGYEIGAAAVLLGTDEHPTPLGVFPILTKERHNVSEKYNNAPMPWTLRLTWDGVAIHGGSTVENGYASHGCISVPDGLAAKLFAIAKKGDKVIITRGKTAAIGSTLI